MYQSRLVACVVNQNHFFHVIKKITMFHNIHETTMDSQLIAPLQMHGMIMFPHLCWLEFHPWKELQFRVRWEPGTSFHPLCLFNVLLCYVYGYCLSCELLISKYIRRFKINCLIFITYYFSSMSPRISWVSWFPTVAEL